MAWMDQPPKAPERPARVERHADAAPATLTQLQALGAQAAASAEPDGALDGLRNEALRQTALALGAQSGLAWRYERIDLQLKRYAAELDTLFAFNRVQDQAMILPPVISEAQQSFRSESPTRAVTSEVSWRIVTPARIVANVPTWRDYLSRRFSPPNVAEARRTGVFPKSLGEVALWRDWVREGWDRGVEQANSIYRDGLARLVRDYTGMTRFRWLAAQDVVSMPVLYKGRLSVQADGRTLNVGNHIYRIVVPADFNEPAKWIPVITQPSDKEGTS